MIPIEEDLLELLPPHIFPTFLKPKLKKWVNVGGRINGVGFIDYPDCKYYSGYPNGICTHRCRTWCRCSTHTAIFHKETSCPIAGLPEGEE